MIEKVRAIIQRVKPRDQMPLTPGTTLGPYEIQSPLGAGGPEGSCYCSRGMRIT